MAIAALAGIQFLFLIQNNRVMITLDKVDSILNECPPVDSLGASSKLTDRYHFISTRRVVDTFRDLGWEPRQAFYVKTKETSDPLHKRHCIRFRNPKFDIDGQDGFGGVTPEIVVNNSHDGSCSLQLMAGLFRMVCSNGLTIREESYGDTRLRHDNKHLRALGEIYLRSYLKGFAYQVPNQMASIKGWEDLEMSRGARLSYYKAAGKLRGLDMHDWRYRQFDAAKRAADQGHDLWTVYNRTQEHLVRGGIKNHYDYDYEKKRNYTTQTPLSNIQRIEDINKDLWSLTCETAASLN